MVKGEAEKAEIDMLLEELNASRAERRPRPLALATGAFICGSHNPPQLAALGRAAKRFMPTVPGGEP